MTLTRSWFVAGCRHREAHRPHSSGTGQLNGPGWELGASERRGDIATARAGVGGMLGWDSVWRHVTVDVCRRRLSAHTSPSSPQRCGCSCFWGPTRERFIWVASCPAYMHRRQPESVCQPGASGTPPEAADPSQKSKRPHNRYRRRPHPPWLACTHMTPPRCPRRPRAGRRARPRRSCGTTRSGARGSLRVRAARQLTSAGVS
eukprot:COSAG01_NODE_212_length_21797_cov_14.197806_15_plen_203_part_00